ncbi:hypothetical protein IM543_11420 [Massilia sp. UMI-21]|nr:hypothetical protein IM543_11420 [Massilia sp. UMI-21]
MDTKNNAAGVPEAVVRKIVTGAREFYLGLLSSSLKGEDFDLARDDGATANVLSAMQYELTRAQAKPVAGVVGDERAMFEAAMKRAGYPDDTFSGFYAEGEFAYYAKEANCMLDSWRAALATHSGAEVPSKPDGWVAVAVVNGEHTSVAFRDEETAHAMCADGEPFPFWVVPARACIVEQVKAMQKQIEGERDLQVKCALIDVMDELRATLAQHSPKEVPSIDTPEFRALAIQFYAGKARNSKFVSYEDLVAHIDTALKSASAPIQPTREGA